MLNYILKMISNLNFSSKKLQISHQKIQKKEFFLNISISKSLLMYEKPCKNRRNDMVFERKVSLELDDFFFMEALESDQSYLPKFPILFCHFSALVKKNITLDDFIKEKLPNLIRLNNLEGAKQEKMLILLTFFVNGKKINALLKITLKNLECLITCFLQEKKFKILSDIEKENLINIIKYFEK